MQKAPLAVSENNKSLAAWIPPIVSAIWMPRADGSLMEPDEPKMRASPQWT
jgi:hypothetical protein